MVLYRLSVLSRVESMRAVEPGVIHTWYVANMDIRGLARRNAKLLHALMEKGLYHRNFLDTNKI